MEKKKNDMLQKIWNHQFDLQGSLGIYDKIKEGGLKMKQQYINQMILALHEEATEIMRETAYKNPEFMPFGWKKHQEFNTNKFRNEIADILHFVMNLAIISGMTAEDLFNEYMGKNRENHERQKNGY